MKTISLRFIRCVKRFVVCALVAGHGPAYGQAAPAPPGGVFVALRLHGEIWVDGKLDEPAWNLARPFDDFVQSLPSRGVPAAERTEVRVLYDDHALYVGVRCHDAHPEEATSPPGKRDRPTPPDAVQVYIDSLHDHRTAAMFQVTSRGGRLNATVYNDDYAVADWDATWEGAAALLADGWSAEFAIPLSALRHSAAKIQQWGFGVHRQIGRSQEWSTTVRRSPGGPGIVAGMGHLDGIEGIEPDHDFTMELVPYLAGRATYQRHGPLAWGPGNPGSTSARFRPVDAGLDVKAHLGVAFNLAATINPDFGEVEPDPLALNLTSFESYFAEKRPFFKEGLELFRPLGMTPSQVPQQMFYARRIGLDAPVLGAAKLVGSAPGWEVGMFDAVVARAGTADDGRESASLPWQPQLAPSIADPLAASVSRNYFAAKARARFAEGLAAGAELSSALPLVRHRCELSAEDPAWQERPPECAAIGGNAVAVHFNSRSKDRQWYAYGQAAASQSVGGPTMRILPDGTRLERGDVGTGAYLRAGREGEPWRTDLFWSWASPRLDLNAMGFQRSQNLQDAKGYLRYVRSDGGGPFSAYALWVMARSAWTTDGSALDLGRGYQISADGKLRELNLGLGCIAAWESSRYDPRQIQRYTAGRALVGDGTALQRPGWSGAYCWADSDPDGALVFGGNAVVNQTRRILPLGAPWRWAAEVYIKARAQSRLETQVGLDLNYNVEANRFAPDTLPADAANWYFAQFAAPSLSVTVRQKVALTPKLALQLYGQLFTYYGKYTRLFKVPQEPGAVHISDLQPVAQSELPAGTRVDFRGAAIVAHAMLRWEYQLGATLLLVYARNQTHNIGGLELSGRFPEHLMPDGLGQGPTGDSLMVKWSHRMGP